MNTKLFSDAMSEIEDRYIHEALQYKNKRKKSGWMKWSVAAACLCIVAAGTFIWKQFATPLAKDKNTIIGNEEITIKEDGITIPLPELSLSSDLHTDMLGFFIYQGRVYMQYEWLEDNGAIAGEPLGTATGLIDEWTPKDSYVELAGSVSGEFYTVNGFDPSFMLCMKHDDRRISTYICNSGITLKYGSDLYEDRLHLSKNNISAEYESRESWYYSREEIHALSSADGTEALNNFIRELNAAEFIPFSSIPLDEGETSPYDKEIYHLYLKMQSGITVELRLFQGGYVIFQGITEVCVQIPPYEFNALIDLFEN